MSDFRRKVAEYLLTSKYKKEAASKNFRKYYNTMKMRTQGVDQSMSVSLSQPNLNISMLKSDQQGTVYAHNQLKKNLFNYDTLMVRVKDETGRTKPKAIGNQSLQTRFLRKMQPFLSDDKIDYDSKMHFMMVQFQQIVDRIESQAFHVQLPLNFRANPSDFNEYYAIDPTKRAEKYEHFISDTIVEKLIETVMPPLIDDFISKPHTPIQIPEVV